MEYELYHHGILGMKWGIRRFQNPDGSLTPAGRKRYAKDFYKSVRNDKNLSRRDLATKYADHKIINDIENNKNRVFALNQLINTKYDGPKEDYDPWTDPEVVKNANKDFIKVYGRKPNLDDYKDYKAWTYIVDDWADKLGTVEKAVELNKAPKWDKAYDAYIKANKKAIEEALGEIGKNKIKFHGYSDEELNNVVDGILFWRDQDTQEARRRHFLKSLNEDTLLQKKNSYNNRSCMHKL